MGHGNDSKGPVPYRRVFSGETRDENIEMTKCETVGQRYARAKAVVNAWAETERDTCVSPSEKNKEMMKKRRPRRSVLEGGTREEGGAKCCQGA